MESPNELTELERLRGENAMMRLALGEIERVLRVAATSLRGWARLTGKGDTTIDAVVRLLDRPLAAKVPPTTP